MLTSKLLASHGVIHEFGTIDEPTPQTFGAYWELKPKWKQVHGVAIAEVKEACQEVFEVDGLWTRQVHLPIGVVTADCVPILLSHFSGRAVAAVHAGWRGTRGHILRHLWEKLIQEGERPAEWIAAVGPAIGACCYEVSEELASEFKNEFSTANPSIVSPHHRRLDLSAINAWELREIGVAKIDILKYCTRCSNKNSSESKLSFQHMFNSFRREPGVGRQFSAVMRVK